MEETSSLLPTHPSDDQGHWVTVRIPPAGQRHFTGIASRYSNEYPAKLTHVVSPSEFVDIVDRLNETIADYWPCSPCYYFGYLCCPCTFGLSVLIPNYCASYSELYATAFLRNVSLKARFFDRKITFTLVKSFCSSFIEIKFPVQLLEEYDGSDLEGQTIYHYEMNQPTGHSHHLNNSSSNNANSSLLASSSSNVVAHNTGNSANAGTNAGTGDVDLSNLIITSVPSAAAFMTKERLKKS